LVISHILLLFSEPEDDWHAEWRVVQESLAYAKVSATEVHVGPIKARSEEIGQINARCTMMKSTFYIQWV